jgi:hypothetical protein
MEKRIFQDDIPVSDVKYGCESCRKSDVCKWVKEFSELTQEVNNLIPTSLSQFVKAEVTCKYYHQKPQGGIR